jgi:hypothetical protein
MTRLITVLVVVMAMVVGSGPVPAGAASEDAAYFQEALAPYGQWLSHPRYGQVWRPHRVDRSWRPYTDGRWVLTQDGYVFETEEPWGWATYHYGNWLYTPDHGWVWVPGRTWYPHTCTWRANDEHVGWAPVPPAEASPSDLGWSGDYGSGSEYGYSGSALDHLPASWWNFTRAADFLPGWGEPYGSRYSYLYSGLLASPLLVPTIYTRTVYIYNYVTPAYAPRACFNWGPPAVYIMKVKRLPQHDFVRHCQQHRLHHLRQVLPPPQVVSRQPVWRHLVPAVAAENSSGRWWRPAPTKAVPLNRPDALPAPPVAASPPRTAAVAPPTPGPSSPAAPAPPRPQAASVGREHDTFSNQTTSGPLAPRPGLTAASPRVAPPSRPHSPASRPGEEMSAKPGPPPPSGPPPRGLGDSPAASTPDANRRPTVASPPPPQPGAPTPGRPEPLPRLTRPVEGERGHQEGLRRPPELPRRHMEEDARQALSQRQYQQRQAEMRRQQQELQARQAEAARQQQMQAQRQAEMIRQQQAQAQRQAEMLRQQHEQRPRFESRPPSPPPRSGGAPPAAPGKKRGPQEGPERP